MYCANDTITVVHFDRNKQVYTCTVINGVSWHTAARRVLQTTDARASQETTVRIPEKNMPAALKIAAGDIICHGIVSGINRRAELEQYQRFEVIETRDNRHGKQLRHWKVTGS